MNEPPDNATPPRYAPQLALPPYTYIPGHTPHPTRDPAGHSYGQTPAHGDDAFACAIDLFNHGYYWEAHEAWESLWHQAGRSGVEGDFLKGLIKLAAAGVKLREQNPAGVLRHARRARELFGSVPHARHRGCSLAQLVDLTRDLEAQAGRRVEPTGIIQLVPCIAINIESKN